MNASTLPCILSLLLTLTARSARADELTELVDRADMALRGDSSAGVLEMEIQTARFRRSYKIVMWDDHRGGHDRSLIKILGPALWRGFGTLKIGGRLQLYDPKTHHVTVVSHSMLGNSWMGSHFTNDDLVKETRLARHYRARLLKTWTATSDLGDATTFRQIRLTPTPSAPVAWDRIVYTIATHGDVTLPTRAEYFRKAGQRAPSRTLTFSDVRDLGGRRLPATIRVTVANKPGEYTLIRYTRLAFDVAIPASKFTVQALRK